MAEDSNGRWTKDYPKKLGWGWFTEPLTAHFFEYCCLKANYKDRTWKGETIKRGAFATSLERMSLETGLSVRQVRTAIKNLTETGEITSKATSKYTIISVCNYDIYQQSEDEERQTNDKQKTSKRQANDKQTTNERQTNDKQTTSKRQTIIESIEDIEELERTRIIKDPPTPLDVSGCPVLETYVEFTESKLMAVPEKFGRFKCDISTHTATIAETLAQLLGRVPTKQDILDILAKAYSDKLYQNNWTLDFIAKRIVQIHNIKSAGEQQKPNNILPEGVEWVNEKHKTFSYIAEDGTRKEGKLGQNEFFENGRRTYKRERYPFPDHDYDRFHFPPLSAPPRPYSGNDSIWNGEEWVEVA